MPEEISISLLSALSPKEEVGLSPPTSRGSPGEFDLLLQEVKGLETTPGMEFLLKPVSSGVLQGNSAEEGVLPEVPTTMGLSILSSGEEIAFAELSSQNFPETSEGTLSPEELDAVVKERDALAAILVQTPFVQELSTQSAETSPSPNDGLVSMLSVDLTVGPFPVSESAPLTTASTPMLPAEPTVILTQENVSVAVETPEDPLLRTNSPEVGKDYLSFSGSEERISPTGLLRSLQAAILSEETPQDELTSSPPEAEREPFSRVGRIFRTTSEGRGTLEVPRVSVFTVTEPLLRNPQMSSGTVSVKVPTGENNPLSTRTINPKKFSVKGERGFVSTPLQRAQEVVLRRAAQVAFLGESLLREGSHLSGSASPRGETVDREEMRILERPLESLVRAERTQPRVRLSEPSESSSVEEWSSPEHTSRVVSQGTTPPVTSVSSSVTTTSTATTPQVYAPLMELIAQEARRNVRLGKREFRIQLKPAHLGSVELEVIWERDVVYVRITAASKESQKILEENIAELERALQKQGLGFEADLPWKTPRWDLRRWSPPWRPGLTLTRS